MAEATEALLRVRMRQITPEIKRAQVAARKRINTHFKALRDDLEIQRVKLGIQQQIAIAASNTAVAAEFESQAKSAAKRNQLAMVIAVDDSRKEATV